ncbi:GGDEF domain-containing protein [Amphritea sp. 1_MG-2023]|uniref:GGDEF domain-containing protein n=1 Tax=Amphritea sp. 1_MG-2023 TaxID=3062670 RepID=UPI0026E14312|nr:GGDEF domain-containing protein [Amphritea sp. 1_MG-2023]MDO6564734.1 GGDEF domain-containing protein [Amphritea sp. 1_MG-2023]
MLHKNYAGYVNLDKIRAIHALKYQLLQLVIFLIVIIYAGYLFDIESLYRPIHNGPATHELTILSALLIVAAVLMDKINTTSVWMIGLAFTAALISLLRLAEIGFEWRLISHLTPFHEVAETAIANNLSHAMGMNTSMAILSLAIALLLRHTLSKLSFSIASIAPFLAFSSLAGYSFGEDALHGAMSFLTITLLLPLSLATLMQWAHYKFLRAIFLHTQMGKISRAQLLLSMTIPWGLGALIVYLSNVNDVYPFALYTTGVSWFIIGMVVFAAVTYERLDSRRRTHERQSHRLSTIDTLTECYTRVEGLKQGQYAVSMAKRNRAPLSLMMFDIDNFKRINDNYGHLAGDQVLKAIADEIKKGLRKTDILTRWGGEEFVVILYDCAEADAMTLADKIRQAIATTNLSLEPQSDLHVTVSIGCSSLTEAIADIPSLFNHADTAMYAAKKTGKNKVVGQQQLNEGL